MPGLLFPPPPPPPPPHDAHKTTSSEAKARTTPALRRPAKPIRLISPRIASPRAKDASGLAEGGNGGNLCRAMGDCDGAVVATVTGTLVAAVRETDDEEAVHVDSEGAPVHASCTVPLKPPCGVSVSVNIADEPGLTDAELGLMPAVKSAPVPVSASVDGPATALLVIVSVPLRVPAPAGVKVRVIVQVAPGFTALVHVLVWEKSDPLAPLIAIFEIVKAALPELLIVTFCAPDAEPTFWPPNGTEVGLSVMPAPTPLPLKPTVWVPPLSTTVKFPLSAPNDVGLNVTVIAQFFETGLVQVFVWAKGPLVAIEVMLSGPFVLTVTVCAALVVPGA